MRPAESYLRGDAILDAARRTGSDAIHPGYGFLSENADFARACQAAGVTFIGPPVEAIAAMGSKIEAKRRMAAAGVPLLPTVEVAGQTAEQVLLEAKPLGWPLLIKASAGGGGRGMRIVHSAGELAELLATARQESESAFGDGTLLIEPYVENSRHIEIQILGDRHGNVVHLFERECSIQRRHQKIIEESPAAAENEDLRRAMAEAAVRGAREIGYQNAGTWEFLLTPEGKFYFLEVNTRLQVEHPVTECVTGLDLVRLQIQIAAGEPLPPEVRSARIDGHAIEARLYAEDPQHEYRPAAGELHRFQIPVSPGIRVESAFDSAGTVSPYYDPMLAKVIAHAPTRTEAARRLSQALRRSQIHGVCTNRELLVRILEHPDFLSGKIDTHFLERHDPRQLSVPLADAETQRLHAVAAALASQALRRREARVLAHVPSGWRNNPSQYQQVRYLAGDVNVAVEYQFQRGALSVRANGEELPEVRCTHATSEQVRLQVGGIERSYDVQRSGDTYYIDSAAGSTELVEVPRFSLPADEAPTGSLKAPLPGVVTEVKLRRRHGHGRRRRAGD